MGTVKTSTKIRAEQVRHRPASSNASLRTLKGWTGVKMLGEDKIEGNCLAHQVVLTEAKTDKSQPRIAARLARCLQVRPAVSPEHGFGNYIEDIMPEDQNKRLGMSKHAHGGELVYKPLVLPKVEEFTETADIPGTMGSSSMRRTGLYLKRVFELNAESKNFRFMSPDETYRTNSMTSSGR